MTIDRAELLLADILEAPSALARLLGAPLPPVGDRPIRVVLTGLGSSRFAALAAESAFRARGIGTVVEYASTRAPTPPAADLVLVAISASGGTPETVEAARRHLGVSRVIAVTNVPDSALAGSADVVLPLLAGEERSGIATRTFRATVALLGLLADRWNGTDRVIGAVVDRLAAIIETRDARLAEAADRFDGAAAIDVLADATDLGLAEQAALMLREGPRLPAHAYETADWLHTGVYLAFPGHRALVFAGSAADGQVIATIGRRGGETIVVGPSTEGALHSIPVPPAGGPIERAVVGSVVAELLAVELWRRTTAIDKGP